MKEREVERLYAMRLAMTRGARDFFSSADFGPLPQGQPSVRIAIYPLALLIRRDVMRERSFVEWLVTHPPSERRGWWGPFLDGWRFVAYADGPVGGRQFDVRLFHSCAVSSTVAMTDLVADGKVRLRAVEQFFNRYALDVANKAFELLRITGPLTIRVSLFNVAGLTAEEIDPWEAGGGGPDALARDTVFEEEGSVEEFRFHRQAVLDRLQDRLASAFGLWREPRGSPASSPW